MIEIGFWLTIVMSILNLFGMPIPWEFVFAPLVWSIAISISVIIFLYLIFEQPWTKIKWKEKKFEKREQKPKKPRL